MNKPRGKPFLAGNKFGKGRPRGSRNKEKSSEQKILEEYAPHLMRKCVALALKGDRAALRLCMDRITAPLRDAPIQMRIATIKTAGDVDNAAAKVTTAVQRGEMTPSEGEVMMNILHGRARFIQTAVLEKRLDVLERAMKEDSENKTT